MSFVREHKASVPSIDILSNEYTVIPCIPGVEVRIKCPQSADDYYHLTVALFEEKPYYNCSFAKLDAALRFDGPLRHSTDRTYNIIKLSADLMTIACEKNHAEAAKSLEYINTYLNNYGSLYIAKLRQALITRLNGNEKTLTREASQLLEAQVQQQYKLDVLKEELAKKTKILTLTWTPPVTPWEREGVIEKLKGSIFSKTVFCSVN